jgi:hypothetical protein
VSAVAGVSKPRSQGGWLRESGDAELGGKLEGERSRCRRSLVEWSYQGSLPTSSKSLRSSLSMSFRSQNNRLLRNSPVTRQLTTNTTRCTRDPQGKTARAVQSPCHSGRYRNQQHDVTRLEASADACRESFSYRRLFPSSVPRTNPPNTNSRYRLPHWTRR